MEIVDYYKGLLKWTPKRVEREVMKLLKEESDLLIDANTDALFHGEDSFGNPLDPPYRSKFYAEFKLHLNPLGVVDLKLTGAFHAKFKLIEKGPLLYIRSTDKKAPELEAKYDAELIYGVQEERLDPIIQKNLLPKVQGFYSREIFKV